MRPGSFKLERLTEFCARTSLHGFAFCLRPDRPKWHSAGWAVIIVVAIGAAIFNLTVNTQEFVRATVAFNLKSPTYSLRDVFLPSVVICNMNLLRKSFILTLMSDPDLEQFSYRELHSTVKRMFVSAGARRKPSSRDEFIVNRILNSSTYNALFDELAQSAFQSDTSPPITSVNMSKWTILTVANITNETRSEYMRSTLAWIAGQFRDGEALVYANYSGWGINFTPGFATDVSQACNWVTPFQKAPGDVLDLRTMVSGAVNGANNGLRLLLDAEAYDYSTALLGSEGFFITVLHQLDIPILKQSGIKISPGTAVDVAVTPSLIDTTATARRRFNPVSRQCYFEDEADLQHLPKNLSYRYAMGNCLFEATLQKIERECHCVHPAFIDFVDGLAVCGGDTQFCMDTLLDHMGSERHFIDKGVRKVCLAACKDQVNSLLLTSALFPSPEAFPEMDEYCIVLAKLQRQCDADRRRALDAAYPELCAAIEAARHLPCMIEVNDTVDDEIVGRVQQEVSQYARKNLVLLTLYIRDPYVKKYLTDEDISEIGFVGSMGGILGLFTGFSFISVIEIIYVCLVDGRDRDSDERLASDRRRWSSPVIPQTKHELAKGALLEQTDILFSI